MLDVLLAGLARGERRGARDGGAHARRPGGDGSELDAAAQAVANTILNKLVKKSMAEANAGAFAAMAGAASGLVGGIEAQRSATRRRMQESPLTELAEVELAEQLTSTVERLALSMARQLIPDKEAIFAGGEHVAITVRALGGESRARQTLKGVSPGSGDRRAASFSIGGDSLRELAQPGAGVDINLITFDTNIYPVNEAADQRAGSSITTVTFTGLISELKVVGGDNRHWLRRSGSIAIFFLGAILGAFLTRYGAQWPLLVASTLLAIAVAILVTSERPADASA